MAIVTTCPAAPVRTPANEQPAVGRATVATRAPTSPSRSETCTVAPVVSDPVPCHSPCIDAGTPATRESSAGLDVGGAVAGAAVGAAVGRRRGRRRRPGLRGEHHERQHRHGDDERRDQHHEHPAQTPGRWRWRERRRWTTPPSAAERGPVTRASPSARPTARAGTGAGTGTGRPASASRAAAARAPADGWRWAGSLAIPRATTSSRPGGTGARALGRGGGLNRCARITETAVSATKGRTPVSASCSTQARA